MYPNAGASQRAQDHSLGLGGRGIHIGGESLQPPWPTPQPAAGGRRLAATRMEISWEPRLDYIYYVACLSRLEPEESSGGCLQCTQWPHF